MSTSVAGRDLRRTSVVQLAKQDLSEDISPLGILLRGPLHRPHFLLQSPSTELFRRRQLRLGQLLTSSSSHFMRYASANPFMNEIDYIRNWLLVYMYIQCNMTYMFIIPSFSISFSQHNQPNTTVDVSRDQITMSLSEKRDPPASWTLPRSVVQTEATSLVHSFEETSKQTSTKTLPVRTSLSTCNPMDDLRKNMDKKSQLEFEAGNVEALLEAHFKDLLWIKRRADFWWYFVAIWWWILPFLHTNFFIQWSCIVTIHHYFTC